MAAANPGLDMGTTGSMRDIDRGRREGAYWRDNFAGRPYVRADCGYDFYRPAYQYASRGASGRTWNPSSSATGRATAARRPRLRTM
jgi:hypothetical protein